MGNWQKSSNNFSAIRGLIEFQIILFDFYFLCFKLTIYFFTIYFLICFNSIFPLFNFFLTYSVFFAERFLSFFSSVSACFKLFIDVFVVILLSFCFMVVGCSLYIGVVGSSVFLLNDSAYIKQ